MHTHGESIAGPGGAIQSLPYRKPSRTWASRGTGAMCDLCNARIHPPDIEYQIELPPNGETGTLHMHFVCHQRWAAQGRSRKG